MTVLTTLVYNIILTIVFTFTMSQGRTISRLDDIVDGIERQVEDIRHDLRTEKKHRREDIGSMRQKYDNVTSLLQVLVAGHSERGDKALITSGIMSNSMHDGNFHDEKFAQLMNAFAKEKANNIRIQNELKSFVVSKVSEQEIMMQKTQDDFEEIFNGKLNHVLEVLNETLQKNSFTEVMDLDENILTPTRQTATDETSVTSMVAKGEAQHNYCASIRQPGICTLVVNSGYEIPVYLDTITDGGGWIVFQRRNSGNTDFYRGWEDYKAGFGDLEGEFWLGNEHIHKLTEKGSRELRVDLEAQNGEKQFAHYSHFQVLSEEAGYELNVSGYSGTAGDSLVYHNGIKFSTLDRDNDPSATNCAVLYTGAWWYKQCTHSNLNGRYGANTGMAWYHFNHKWEAMKKAEMKIR